MAKAIGLLVLLFSGFAAAESVANNELRVSDRVVLTGVIRTQASSALADSGALVVDLRRPIEHGAPAAAERLREAGVEVVNLPMDGGVPDGDLVRRFSEVLDNAADRPVYVQCASGNRAGLIWAAYQIQRGMPVTLAMASVDGIVTRDSIRRSIRTFATERREHESSGSL